MPPFESTLGALPSLARALGALSSLEGAAEALPPWALPGVLRLGGLLALASPAAGAQGLLFLLIGWLGCGAIVSFSLWFELRKAHAIITELDGAFGAAQGQGSSLESKG